MGASSTGQESTMLMTDLCASASMADMQNHHGVVVEMLTVTHEIRAGKGDARIGHAPIDLDCAHCLQLLCSLTNSRLHKAKVLS